MSSLVKMSSEVTFALHGFAACEIPLAAEEIGKYVVPDGCFPQLKSNPVHVVREDRPTPLYVCRKADYLCLIMDIFDPR